MTLIWTPPEMPLIWTPPERKLRPEEVETTAHFRFTHSEPTLDWRLRRLEDGTIEETLTLYPKGKAKTRVWRNGRRYRGGAANGPAR